MEIIQRKVFNFGYKIYKYDFQNLSKFLDYLSKAKINERVFDKNKLVSSGKRFSWSGTKKYCEAARLCRDGWDYGYEEYCRLREEIKSDIADAVYELYMTDSNLPTKFCINLSESGVTNRSTIMHQGVIILALAEALMSSEYSVEVEACVCLQEGDEVILASIKLNDGYDLDIRQAVFPLCHPAFHLQLVSRLVETTPVESRHWRKTYGMPVCNEILKNFVEPDLGTIITPSQPGHLITGRDIHADVHVLLDYINHEMGSLRA